MVKQLPGPRDSGTAHCYPPLALSPACPLTCLPFPPSAWSPTHHANCHTHFPALLGEDMQVVQSKGVWVSITVYCRPSKTWNRLHMCNKIFQASILHLRARSLKKPFLLEHANNIDPIVEDNFSTSFQNTQSVHQLRFQQKDDN